MSFRFAAALLLVASAPAFSQVEEVVVTGSRIPQPNLTSASPIQVTTSQEIRQQGFMDMSDLLRTLPQYALNAGSDLSNNSNPLFSGGGMTQVDLRGLGTQRTLVLVDGRRLGPGDPNTAVTNPGADLDQIPAALVERVEVVTGGASAVYGSDAIAGVVNFILNKDFQGIPARRAVGSQSARQPQHDHADPGTSAGYLA